MTGENKKNNFVITEINNSTGNQATEFIKNIWTSGDPVIVSKGKVHYIENLPGYFVSIGDEIAGVITYDLENNECEIVSLDSKIENKGIGSALLNKVIEKAGKNRCRRVWLITTNDNIRAIRFYQKRNFDMAAFYRNEVEKERKIKPGIPMFGTDGIPVKHEIEFELLL
jgi:GNAT superfamily N-acetyltransferase